jgi:hypothetical protein
MFGTTAKPTCLCSCLIDFEREHLRTAGEVRPNPAASYKGGEKMTPIWRLMVVQPTNRLSIDLLYWLERPTSRPKGRKCFEYYPHYKKSYQYPLIRSSYTFAFSIISPFQTSLWFLVAAFEKCR